LLNVYEPCDEEEDDDDDDADRLAAAHRPNHGGNLRKNTKLKIPAAKP